MRLRERAVFFLPSYKIKIESKKTYSGLPSVRYPNQNYVATYYQGFRLSNIGHRQPHLMIGFNKIDTDSEKINERASSHAGLVSSFLDIRLGSIWKNQQLEKSITTSSQTFKVNHNEGGWITKSFQQLEQKGLLPSLISKNLDYLKDSHALIFKTKNLDGSDGPILIIPCINYFFSTFGHSIEFKRVLCTYPWDDIKERFELNFEEKEADGWTIKHPRGGFCKGDYKALACAKYTKIARNSFKSFSAQIQKTSPGKIISPLVIPWFNGYVPMKISGIETLKNYIFVWHIYQYKSPNIPEITVHKDKSVPAPANEDKGFDPFSYAQESPRRAKDDQIRHNTLSPDTDSHDYWVENTYTSDIGHEPEINIVYVDKEKFNYGKQKPTDDQSYLSSGERSGNGNDTGRLITSNTIDSISSKTFGAIEEMWEYIHQSSLNPNHLIKNAKWLSASGEWLDELDIEYTLLSTLSCDQDYPQSHKYLKDQNVENLIPHIKKSINWLHLKRECRYRGYTLIKFNINENHVFIFEIEREIKPKSKESDELIELGPKGLIFSLNSTKYLDYVLKVLVDEIRFSHSFNLTLLSQLYRYGNFQTFKHVKSKMNDNGKSFVNNALSKLKPIKL